MSYCRNTSNEEEKELKRLKEEVAMLGRLRHPNIVRCLGATQVPGHFNIFVEWMAGQCAIFLSGKVEIGKHFLLLLYFVLDYVYTVCMNCLHHDTSNTYLFAG